MMRKHQAAALVLFSCLLASAAAQQARQAQQSQQAQRGSVERGRYLARIAGCNDCHTPGYGMSGGRVPESQWLVGDQLGFRGPWGTTYPVNLRLYMQKVSEEEWLKIAKTRETRPPMPWFALRDMSESDLVSLYRFIRHLGPAGEPAPGYQPPGTEPKGPFVQFPQPPG